jgi:hypothetical protein
MGLCAWPSAGSAQNVTAVDCHADSNALTQALQSAAPKATFLVSGTCRESATVTTDDIVIDGQHQTILDGAGSGEAVLTIDAARRITIQNLTVRGGTDGVVARRGATVIMRQVTATDNTDDGIQLETNAVAQLTDCTLQRNGDYGLEVAQNSTVNLCGTTQATANDSGMLIVDMSHGDIGAPAYCGATPSTVQVQDNAEDGIVVIRASNLSIVAESTVTVTDNGDDGLHVTDGAALRIMDSTVRVENNGAAGPSQLGIVFLYGSTGRFVRSSVTVHGNASIGVTVGTNSNLSLANSMLVTTNNQREGLHVTRTSSLDVNASSTLHIEQNARAGLQVEAVSSATCASGSTVSLSGNGGGDHLVASDSVSTCGTP